MMQLFKRVSSPVTLKWSATATSDGREGSVEIPRLVLEQDSKLLCQLLAKDKDSGVLDVSERLNGLSSVEFAQYLLYLYRRNLSTPVEVKPSTCYKLYKLFGSKLMETRLQWHFSIITQPISTIKELVTILNSLIVEDSFILQYVWKTSIALFFGKLWGLFCNHEKHDGLDELLSTIHPRAFYFMLINWEFRLFGAKFLLERHYITPQEKDTFRPLSGLLYFMMDRSNVLDFVSWKTKDLIPMRNMDKFSPEHRDIIYYMSGAHCFSIIARRGEAKLANIIQRIAPYLYEVPMAQIVMSATTAVDVLSDHIRSLEK